MQVDNLLNTNPTRKLTVVVLGVGGNVSQGILKALALSAIPDRVVGACISPSSAGLYMVDKAYLSPLASDPQFVPWLKQLCRTEQVDAILSGVEPILAVLSEAAHDLRSETKAVSIVSDPDCLAISDDKLLTCQWLERQGLNFPPFADASEHDAVDALLEQCGLPLIAKPRRGKGAQGIIQITDTDSLDAVRKRPGYLIQQYLGTPDDEYTVGCFSDRDYVVRGAIAMRRQIMDGTTVRAEVGDYPEVRHEAIRIASALKPMGPCNMQMRMHAGRPICFEINARFSGTTPMRARFGFNDVDAALKHFVLGQSIDDLSVTAQGVCLRYWNEIYIAPETVQKLQQSTLIDNVRAHNITIEDYGMRG